MERIYRVCGIYLQQIRRGRGGGGGRPDFFSVNRLFSCYGNTQCFPLLRLIQVLPIYVVKAAFLIFLILLFLILTAHENYTGMLCKGFLASFSSLFRFMCHSFSDVVHFLLLLNNKWKMNGGKKWQWKEEKATHEENKIWHRYTCSGYH